jgi:FkbM family methyltransferase
MAARPYALWARALLSPRGRLLPALGHRLDHHPRLAAGVLTGLRRAPTRRLRSVLYRNVSRPLVERMDARLVVPIAPGSRMVVDTSDTMGRVLASSGVWEPHVTALLPSLLSPGDVTVDVGAHIGYHALIASRLVGPTGVVYAVEPSTAFAELEENLALNASSNVRAVRVAAGSSMARAHLVEAPAGNTGEAAIRIVEPEAASDGAVDVVPVTSIVEEQDVSRLQLVKIDVEGFEPEVLSGVRPLLERGCSFALIVEVHPHRTAATVEALEHLRTTFSFASYEVVRVPAGDRFAPAPPPRPLTTFHEVEQLSRDKTVNVLLLPEGSRPRWR